MRYVVRWITAHRRAVAAAWIIGALGILAASQLIGARSDSDFTLPGTGSQQSVNLLQSRFPSQAGDADEIVFHARSGTLNDAADRAEITQTLRRVARLDHVVDVSSPYTAGSMSREKTIAFATVIFDESSSALPTSAVKRVITVAQSAASPQLEVALGGQAIEAAQRQSPGFATAVGVIAAVVILLIALGSLAAMSLPLLTAMFGLLAGVGLIGLVGHVIGMASFASELALMVGLGVGIDYALFILTRFRESYRTNGGDIAPAVEDAMNSAGRAVLLAGITVVVALLGMFALGVNLLNGVAVAAALGVLMVLLAALTLLPALLGIFGRRIGEGGRLTRRRQRRHPGNAAESRFWTAWVTRVQRHPAIAAIAVTSVLLALAAPALNLTLGSSDAGTDASTQTTRHAYDLLAKGFGPGFNGPLQIAVALPSRNDSAAVTTITDALKNTPGIASVSPARLSAAGTAAAIIAYPTTSPQSTQTAALVTHLRTSVLPQITPSTQTHAYIGGATASQVDFSHVLSNKLPEFLAVVIALGALLLLIVFRSFAIPITAAAMNLLSILASLGVTQAIFERGWGASLLNVQKGTVDAFIPVLAFAIIFGLTTDYEVFLVSRIHEEWQDRQDPRAAITYGFARTARVVIAAAAVMACVFGAFAISGQRDLAEFGVELGVAVLLDAILVRMLLLPAVLQLLGRTAWALPHWLGRLLPRIVIEAAPANAGPLEPHVELPVLSSATS
jgi:putative drug exporter of the RND superfamily